MTIPAQLHTLQQVNASILFARDIVTRPAGYDCTVHDTELTESLLETISGWHAAITCPLHSGDCQYGPDVDVIAVEDPELDTPQTPETPASAEPATT